MQKNITDNTCRICLKDCEVLISLFDEVEDFNNLNLIDLLASFGDVKIDLTDNYPKYICNECTTELLITAKFRQKCQKTQEILSHFISEETSEEYVYDDDNNNSDCVENSPRNNAEIKVKQKFETTVEREESVNSLEQYEIKSPQILYDDDCVGEYSLNNNDNLEDEQNDDSENEQVREENPSYIIFDSNELGDDIIAEIQSNILEKSSDDIQKISDDQILYDRIVNAANAAVVKKFSRKSITQPKPQIINCNCEVCGAGFTYVTSLRKHLETHALKEIYECAICSWPFIEIDKLELHCLLEHSQTLNSDNEENNCTENDENDESLRESDSNIQSNVKKKSTSCVKYDSENNQKETKRSHVCDRCQKTFMSKSALVAHVRVHTGDRPFKCSECSKTFKTQGGLALHTRRHTGYRPYLCTICNRRFVESSNLKVHMRIHTGEKPHKCTVCGRGFSRVFLLQLHQRTHTGEKPYHCPYCDKAFAQQGDLCTHKRIHTGERPHKCPHCDKSFIKSSALSVHIRKHMKSSRSKLISFNTKNTNMMTGDNDSQDQENGFENSLSHQEENVDVTTDDARDVDESKTCEVDNLDSILVDIESKE